MSQSKKFFIKKPIHLDETRYHEFKEITSSNPVRAIVNEADEYAVAYLNTEGGTIFWGVNNDGVIVGVSLNYQERDKLRKSIVDKLNEIKPKIDPTQFRIELHQLYDDSNNLVQDSYLVEMIIPHKFSNDPYRTGSDKVFVKTDAGKKHLDLQQLLEWVRSREVQSLNTAKEYRQQFDPFNTEIVKKIRSKTYWQVVIRPVIFDKNYIAKTEIEKAIQAASIQLSGRNWRFPRLESTPDMGNDYLGHECDLSQRWFGFIEAWRFYQSGQFIHFLANATDWQENAQPNPAVLIEDVIGRFTEIFYFASRLVRNGVYQAEDIIRIEVTLARIGGKKLLSQKIRILPWLMQTQRNSQLTEFSYLKEFTSKDLATNYRELAQTAAGELIEFFGIPITPEHLQLLQKEFN